MSRLVVEIQVRAVAAASGGCAVFLGNEDKVFVMFVDQSVGRGDHDFYARHAKGAAAHSRSASDHLASLVLSAKNESQQKKIIQIDTRSSDCIAMATQQRAPIYVSLDVWDEVQDMTEALRKMQEESSKTEDSDQEGDS